MSEFREHVRQYAESCLELQKHCSVTLIEQTLESSEVADCGGTPDFAALSKCGTTIYLNDLKYGQGVRVLAEGNEQLLLYAALLLEMWPDAETVVMSIFQPRVPGPGVDTVEVSADEVREWFKKYRERTRPENAGEFHAGDHCRWCKAVSTCPHLFSISWEISQHEFGPVADREGELSRQIDRWQEIERMEPALNAAIKAAKANLLTAAEAGHKVPGRKLVTKYGNRRWSDTAVLGEVCRQIGIPHADVIKETWLSPAQFEKKGLLDQIPEHLIDRPEVGHLLVGLDDGRPEITTNLDDEFDAV